MRSRQRELWETLLSAEDAIRSRLHDMFLDLLIDRENEIAFVRPTPYEEAPEVVRTHRLTLMDTAMLLLLRQILLREDTRAMVGKDELRDALGVYRRAGRDEKDFNSRVNASWKKLVGFGLLREAEDERAKISPTIRYLVNADQVGALTQAFNRIAEDQ